MKSLLATTLVLLSLGGCTEKGHESSSTTAATTSPSSTTSGATAQTNEQIDSAPAAVADASSTVPLNENHEEGTWNGQIAFAQPVSMFNYVGAESGDFAPMRFRNDSEAGKKILVTCSNGEMCGFTGAVEWLDETPPPDASAVGQIVRVDSVKPGTTGTP